MTSEDNQQSETTDQARQRESEKEARRRALKGLSWSRRKTPRKAKGSGRNG